MSEPSNTSIVVPALVARKRVMDSGVQNLIAWLEHRERGVHNPLTTLTLLERKVCELRAKVVHAGGGDDAEECGVAGNLFPSAL